MVANQSLWIYFADAGPVVKSVMLLLLTASVISWTFIIQRGLYFKRMRDAAGEFEQHFWSGAELSALYTEFNHHADDTAGLAKIFCAGFEEYIRCRKQGGSSHEIQAGVDRAMRIAKARETDNLERHLPFLASVGSVSPYIGLFGTVWGIMTAFHALGSVQQATIAMVAPGISEALVATAMGLFAAIPAVLAYNRFAAASEKLLHQYDTFQEEFSSILQRDA